MAGQLRPGDQVACDNRGNFITNEQEYVNLSLLDDDVDEKEVRWVVVHSSDANDPPPAAGDDRTWVLYHTRGVEAVAHDLFVVAREVIELDPWSYLRSNG